MRVKLRIVDEMSYIIAAAGDKVVDADNIITIG
jgi:hypothetical protein